MLEGSSVIVVVPAFEEELHVGRVLRTMPDFVDRIVVVDDGSGDGTSEVVRRYAKDVAGETVVLLRHERRRGVGAALVTGYLHALSLGSAGARATDALCVMAGDGQMHPDDLRAVALPVVRGEAAYVKGDRFVMPGVRRAMGTPRWIGGQVFSRLTGWATKTSISDSQCGFTALSRSAAERVDLDRLWPSFGYPNDLLGRVAARGLPIREVPVRPLYGTETSKLRLRHLPPIFFLIARAAVRRRAPTWWSSRPRRSVDRSGDAVLGRESTRAPLRRAPRVSL